MKALAYDRPHRLSALHDELLAAVPALRPVPDPDRPGRRLAVMAVSGDGARVVLEVPDGTDEAAIGAVVAAHDPTAPLDPTPPDFGADAQPADQLAAAVASLRQYVGLTTPTLPQTAGAVKLLIRLSLFLVRRAL